MPAWPCCFTPKLRRSDGEPRQEINPWIQCRGYRDALKYVESRNEVDPERIALWGDSYTGGQVIVVGAIEQRVKGIVAQCPVFGAEPPAVEPNMANFDRIKEILLRGDVRGSALCAPFINAHTLLMVAPEDEMVHANYAVARQAFELIPGPKQWYDISGGHFGLLYCPSDLFDEASRVQTEFLKKWLGAVASQPLHAARRPGERRE